MTCSLLIQIMQSHLNFHDSDQLCCRLRDTELPFRATTAIPGSREHTWHTWTLLRRQTIVYSPRKFKVGSLSSVNLPEVFRLKLMALDTSYNGLLAINRLPINLKQIKKDAFVARFHGALCSAKGAECARIPYSADPTGVMLHHIVLQGRLAGVSPRTEGLLALVGLRIAGLLSQVVKLKGDFVVGVKEASITQVSVLCYQNLCHTVKSSVSLAVHSGITAAIWDVYWLADYLGKTHAWSSYPSILARMNWSMLYWANALYETEYKKLHLDSGPYYRFLHPRFLTNKTHWAAPSLRRPSLFSRIRTSAKEKIAFGLHRH